MARAESWRTKMQASATGTDRNKSKEPMNIAKTYGTENKPKRVKTSKQCAKHIIVIVSLNQLWASDEILVIIHPTSGLSTSHQIKSLQNILIPLRPSEVVRPVHRVEESKAPGCQMKASTWRTATHTFFGAQSGPDQCDPTNCCTNASNDRCKNLASETWKR